ncbi:unnamed protein product, partial [Ectocarpus sp. 12 AP-2014]
AASSGSVELTIYLLSTGSASISRAGGDNDWTPLMFAAYRGYLHMIRVLLQWGANISAKTEHGHTALHLVVCVKHLAVTKALIKAGADIEAVINFFKEEGVSGTPLHVAASKGFCTGMMVLINAGANINSYNRS